MRRASDRTRLGASGVGGVIGLYGMMLAFVGMDPQTGIARYSEDFLFMWEGIDLITAILALFAVPEMIALSVKGGSS